jgi:hypothetical protein
MTLKNIYLKCPKRNAAKANLNMPSEYKNKYVDILYKHQKAKCPVNTKINMWTYFTNTKKLSVQISMT